MPREETAQSIIDCSGRLSDLVKRMAESEKSIHPSKVSIYTYESAATESQNVDDFSSYKENYSEQMNEEQKLEGTQNLINMLMQKQANDLGLFKELKELKIGTKKL